MMHEFCSHCDVRNTSLFGVNQQVGERIESLKSEIERLKEQVDYYKAQSNRKRGHWINSSSEWLLPMCSVCGISSHDATWQERGNYCPACGAKMDEEEKQ